jgi:hypothetical protein
VRNWGPQRKAGMQAFLSRLVVLTTAKPWPAGGESFRPTPSSGVDHGQTNATWIAACCLVRELPLATVNLKDFTSCLA